VITLDDWLAHLEGLHPKGQAGIELGLERAARVKQVLQQRQTCPVVVVGGTNGKGSTCAYLEAICRAAGYRVGCYTSPHLLIYNERVRIDGTPVEDEILCAAFARVEAARQAAGNVALTYFEFGTLAAWEVFAEQSVDLIILEVGLGGRLDAVNIYDGDVSVITGIALDHTDWLGSTRDAIGYEKAGIFRRGRPAICADAEPPRSLLEHAGTIGADLQLIGREFGFSRCEGCWAYWNRRGATRDLLPLPALAGAHQSGIAAAVLSVIDCLQARLPVARDAVDRGLREVRLAGRFQSLCERPEIIVDVAHNPQAVAGLAQTLSAHENHGRTFAVVGMLADKDVTGALRAMAGAADVWLLASLDGPRGASAEVLDAAVRDGRLGGEIECFASVSDAFRRAVGVAGENDRILAFGSFVTVAAVLREMKQES